jgi:hypothetical protein
MNAPYPVSDPFELEKIFLWLKNYGNFEILFIDRAELNPKTREQTEDMLVALTKLFYEMVFKKSPAWRKASLEWQRKKKEWKVDFDESFRAFIEGTEKVIELPPDRKVKDVYIYVEEGETSSIFMAEKELIFAFLKEADRLIFNEFAKPLNFGVLIATVEFFEALSFAHGVLVSVIPRPDGSICYRWRLVL